MLDSLSAGIAKNCPKQPFTGLQAKVRKFGRHFDLVIRLLPSVALCPLGWKIQSIAPVFRQIVRLCAFQAARPLRMRQSCQTTAHCFFLPYNPRSPLSPIKVPYSLEYQAGADLRGFVYLPRRHPRNGCVRCHVLSYPTFILFALRQFGPARPVISKDPLLAHLRRNGP